MINPGRGGGFCPECFGKDTEAFVCSFLSIDSNCFFFVVVVYFSVMNIKAPFHW